MSSVGRSLLEGLGACCLNHGFRSIECYTFLWKLTLTMLRATRAWGPFLESPEKPFVKLRPACSVKLVFSYVVKGIKFKITAKFRASRRLRFKDRKRIMSPEMGPKSFGTSEKRAPGRDLNADLCDIGVVLYQLSYETNWELVIK